MRGLDLLKHLPFIIVVSATSMWFGQGVPDAGFDCATMTHPGNRPVNEAEASRRQP